MFGDVLYKTVDKTYCSSFRQLNVTEFSGSVINIVEFFLPWTFSDLCLLGGLKEREVGGLDEAESGRHLYQLAKGRACCRTSANSRQHPGNILQTMELVQVFFMSLVFPDTWNMRVYTLLVGCYLYALSSFLGTFSR